MVVSEMRFLDKTNLGRFELALPRVGAKLWRVPLRQKNVGRNEFYELRHRRTFT